MRKHLRKSGQYMEILSEAAKPGRAAVFFDFDNTITAFDVIDDMLIRFSKDDKWLDLEKQWKAKRIGSRKCLDGQVRGIRVSKDKLDKYLTKVEIDPYFKRLLKLLRARKIRTIFFG